MVGMNAQIVKNTTIVNVKLEDHSSGLQIGLLAYPTCGISWPAKSVSWDPSDVFGRRS